MSRPLYSLICQAYGGEEPTVFTRIAEDLGDAFLLEVTVVPTHVDDPGLCFTVPRTVDHIVSYYAAIDDLSGLPMRDWENMPQEEFERLLLGYKVRPVDLFHRLFVNYSKLQDNVRAYLEHRFGVHVDIARREAERITKEFA